VPHFNLFPVADCTRPASSEIPLFSLYAAPYQQLVSRVVLCLLFLENMEKAMWMLDQNPVLHALYPQVMDIQAGSMEPIQKPPPPSSLSGLLSPV
jgi:hypothetical protein